MIAVIANVLKARLSNLDWVERFTGLVRVAERPNFVAGADGAQVVTGYSRYPVSCEVNAANCWERGLYKHFEPDSTKAAIAFFVDRGGVNSVEQVGKSHLRHTFNLRFLMWINTKRVGSEISGDLCDITARVTPYVIGQFWGQHSPVPAYDDEGVEAQIYHNINVTNIRQPEKTPALFNPFTFSTDDKQKALFLAPYDYFALDISGDFLINKNCLPELYTTPYEFEAAVCIPE